MFKPLILFFAWFGKFPWARLIWSRNTQSLIARNIRNGNLDLRFTGWTGEPLIYND